MTLPETRQPLVRALLKNACFARIKYPTVSIHTPKAVLNSGQQTLRQTKGGWPGGAAPEQEDEAAHLARAANEVLGVELLFARRCARRHQRQVDAPVDGQNLSTRQTWDFTTLHTLGRQYAQTTPHHGQECPWTTGLVAVATLDRPGQGHGQPKPDRRLRFWTLDPVHDFQPSSIWPWTGPEVGRSGPGQGTQHWALSI